MNQEHLARVEDEPQQQQWTAYAESFVTQIYIQFIYIGLAFILVL